MVVSSAKERTLRDVDRDKSLIYIRNKSGPKIEPCGTPTEIDDVLDLQPFISVNCVRLDK